MSRELQDWFRNLGQSLTTDIAQEWASAVEQELVQPIRAAAPVGETDHLQQSVRKVQGIVVGEELPDILRDTLAQPDGVRQFNGTGDDAGVTQWVVLAGGALTTKPVRKGATQAYDYALATEFGTQKERAHQFFWNTARAHFPRLAKRAEQIVTQKLAKF